jgi:hypothetical protein
VAVTYDTAGPTSAGIQFTTNPGTWTHVNGGNGVAVGVTTFTGGSNTVTGVTYGGVTVPLLGFIPSNNGTAGGVALYALVGPTCPTGSNTVSVAVSDAPANHEAGSISVAGAGSLGAVVTAFANGAGVSGSFPGTTSGGLIISVVCQGSFTALTATSPNINRVQKLGSNGSGSDNIAMGTDPSTGGTVAPAWACVAADFWGFVGVEVLPGGAASTPVPHGGKYWRKRRHGGRTPVVPPSTPTALSGAATLSGQGTLGASYSYGAVATMSGQGTLGAVTTPAITGIGGSGAGSYFVDATGAPRFLLADNPWALIPNAGRWGGTYQTDIDGYCNNRGGQGYTAIYLDPLGNTENNGVFADGRTNDGVFPFTVNGSAASTASLAGTETIGLNNAFWTRVDYFITACTRNGMTAMLNIGYEGPGDFASGGALASMTSTQFNQYGAALAARYASVPNIIWVVGNDYFGGTGGTIGSGGGTPAGDDAKFSSILTGLRGGGDSHLVTIHNYPETTSRQDIGLGTVGTVLQWGNNNAQFNGVYSYNTTYLGIEDAYGEAGTILVMQLDGYFYQGGSAYAGGSGSFAYDRSFRQDLWWTISSGARGHSHGSESIWQWASTALSASGTDWFHVHNAPNVRALLESLPNWHKLLPDTASALVTSGRGTRHARLTSGGGSQYETAFTDSFVTASRTPDTGSGSDLALIYLSHATTIGIDQTKMVSGYVAFWVDPITGAKTATTAGSSYNSATPGNNSQGDPDWLLVLQAPSGASRTATLSGQGTLTASPAFTPTAALSGSGTLGASPAFAAASTLSGQATLGAAPAFTSSATLSGSGTLGATPVKGFVPTAALSGQGTLSASPTFAAAATLSGQGTLSASSAFRAAASLSGQGTLSASPALAPTATLSGQGTLTASPVKGFQGAAALSGQGTLGATPAFTSTATLSGQGTLSAATGGAGTATLSGQGTLTATPAFTPTATLSGQGTLSASPAFQGAAALSGQGTLAATPAFAPTSTLSGQGTLSASPVLGFRPAAVLSGQGTLTASPSLQAGSALSGQGTLTASPAFAPSSTLSGQGTLTAAVGGVPVFGSDAIHVSFSEIQYHGDSDAFTVDDSAAVTGVRGLDSLAVAEAAQDITITGTVLLSSSDRAKVTEDAQVDVQAGTPSGSDTITATESVRSVVVQDSDSASFSTTELVDVWASIPDWFSQQNGGFHLVWHPGAAEETILLRDVHLTPALLEFGAAVQRATTLLRVGSADSLTMAEHAAPLANLTAVVGPEASLEVDLVANP